MGVPATARRSPPKADQSRPATCRAGGGRPERDRRAAGPAAVPAGRHQPPELLRGRDDAPHRYRQHGRRGLRGKHRLQSLRCGRPAAHPGGQHPGQRGPLHSRPGPQGLTDIAVSTRVRQKSAYADALIQRARALRAEEMPGGHHRGAPHLRRTAWFVSELLDQFVALGSIEGAA
ncbi:MULTISPECIES: DUF6415 family natural product biosynthesis protein [unclassified Streptomyces]|uniref:DUF6415 family natural product biosynthesis protein n=1 Tax=unclassified Streptomyces TaxID=2593676 RepID=UPI0038663054